MGEKGRKKRRRGEGGGGVKCEKKRRRRRGKEVVLTPQTLSVGWTMGKKWRKKWEQGLRAKLAFHRSPARNTLSTSKLQHTQDTWQTLTPTALEQFHPHPPLFLSPSQFSPFYLLSPKSFVALLVRQKSTRQTQKSTTHPALSSPSLLPLPLSLSSSLNHSSSWWDWTAAAAPTGHAHSSVMWPPSPVARKAFSSHTPHSEKVNGGHCGNCRRSPTTCDQANTLEEKLHMCVLFNQNEK